MPMRAPTVEAPRLASEVPQAALTALFAEARAAAGVHSHTYRIAGEPVRLEFAGSALADRFAGAFAHLEVPAGEASLVVRIWDSESGGTAEPPFADTLPQTTDGSGPIGYYERDGFRALARWRTLSAYDAGSSLAWFWAPSSSAMLSWDWASPLRSILHWWLGGRGILQVHGGAVGFTDGGVLLVGRGGSGKSTSTLASVGSQLLYAGDDFVALEPADTPWIHSLYSSGKLEPLHAERFPRLAAAAVRDVAWSEGEKLVFHVHERMPEGTSSGFPLRAVVVPRIVGGPVTRTRPLAGAAALTALAPSTIFQLHPPQKNALATMGDVLSRVPAYSLELGDDIAAIPDALSELLDRASAA